MPFIMLQFVLKGDLKCILDIKVFNFMEYRHEPIELIEAEIELMTILVI
jgi:hypothetical protein